MISVTPRAMISVTPRDRCNQFLKEYLTVSGRKLFCGCCREEVSPKLSSIKHLIDSNKHKVNREKEVKRVVSEKTLAQQLQAYESEALNQPMPSLFSLQPLLMLLML